MREVFKTRVSTIPDHFLHLVAELLLNLLGQLLLALLPEVDPPQVRHKDGLEDERPHRLQGNGVHLELGIRPGGRERDRST